MSKLESTVIEPGQLLTSYQVGGLLQVNPSSVNKWIKEERLAAFRTPGGHRRIRALDLVTFLTQHEMPVPPSLEKAGKKRLLICDDDPKQLRALKRLLDGYSDQLELCTTDNGIEALVQVGSFKPDLILLDVFMDDVDGIEICRRLKNKSETAHIRVLVASGQLNETLHAQALEAGASQCLHKPVELRTLIDELGLKEFQTHLARAAV